MIETRIQIGDEVLLSVDISSDWYISGAGYDGNSVDITLRRKSDRENCWTYNEPQTEETEMEEYYKDHDEFYDCDRYVITNDEGERAYNCIGCEHTDCSWK